MRHAQRGTSPASTTGRGAGLVGYNVQAAVDAKNHLIVAHVVTNASSDRSALHAMARHAREATELRDIEVVADRGCFAGEQILACEQVAILAPPTAVRVAKVDGTLPDALTYGFGGA